jgi:integrase
MLNRYLEDEEQRRLLNTLRLHAGVLAQRDSAVIRLLIHTGMRIGECLHLTIADATSALKSGYIFIPKEYRKGRTDEKRDHEVLVTVSVRVALHDLLALRAGALMTDALIVSRVDTGHAMTVRAFELRVSHWANKAGLRHGVSPHWFRHTRAMNIMAKTTSNDPLGIVKAALGHASIRSTEVYARQTRQSVDAALHEVDSAKPRLRLKDLRKQYEGRVVA